MRISVGTTFIAATVRNGLGALYHECAALFISSNKGTFFTGGSGLYIVSAPLCSTFINGPETTAGGFQSTFFTFWAFNTGFF